MNSQRAHEVLYESEAALRLVDNELTELRNPITPLQSRQTVLAELPAILARANSQILAVFARLRDTRVALQLSALEKLQATHDKLKEVTSATEDAAINIMDACDRASHIIDELDGIDAQPHADKARATTLRSALRDEIFLMMGALQFQDMTTQQLTHASDVLVEMEQRLLDVARLFDSNHDAPALELPDPDFADALSYDPNASVHNAEARQALADEIFTAIKAPAA